MVPALPGFVFLPLVDMAPAATMRLCLACPGFSFMNINGTLIKFAERELVPLRTFDHHVSTSQANPLPPVGAWVVITSGSFQGLRGKVSSNTKRESWVRFEGFSTDIKIPPFLLSKIDA